MPTLSADEAAAVSSPLLEAAAVLPADELCHVHEIFHHARILCADGERQARIDHLCLAAVANECELFLADHAPLPSFLDGGR